MRQPPTAAHDQPRRCFGWQKGSSALGCRQVRAPYHGYPARMAGATKASPYTHLWPTAATQRASSRPLRKDAASSPSDRRRAPPHESPACRQRRTRQWRLRRPHHLAGSCNRGTRRCSQAGATKHSSRWLPPPPPSCMAAASGSRAPTSVECLHSLQRGLHLSHPHPRLGHLPAGSIG
jgi:hypothetical protein